MACLLVCAIAVLGAEDMVRLHLRDGTVLEGAILDIDGEGRYLVRGGDGVARSIPYQEVLDTVRLDAHGVEAGPGRAASPEWPAFRRERDLVELALRQVAALPPSDSEEARAAFGLAVENLRRGDKAAASVHLSNAVKHDPGWSLALLVRAAALADIGSVDAAQEDSAALLLVDPTLSPALEVAAEVCYRRGLRLQGEARAAAAIAAAVEGPQRDWLLGHFWRARDPELSRAHFEAYRAADPELSNAYCVEGRVLARARAARQSGRLDAAIEAYGELFRENPFLAAPAAAEYGAALKYRARRLAEAGRTGAAAGDLEEAAALLPDEETAILEDLRRLGEASLAEACDRARSAEHLAVLRVRIAELWADAPPERLRLAVARAYDRLVKDALAAGSVDRACRAIEAAHAAGIPVTASATFATAVRTLKDRATGPEAAHLADSIARVDPEFLRGDGRFLLDIELPHLRSALLQGEGAAVKARLAELAARFGASPALERLGDECAIHQARGDGGGAMSPGAARNHLLTHFPVDEGRWWVYESVDGRRERWSVASVGRTGEALRVHFTGEVSGPEGSIPAEKDVYITATEILAHAPSVERGGRLLLWTPADPAAQRTIRQGPALQEHSTVSLDENVACRGKSFANCRHVAVRHALADPQTGEARFAATSHAWYAPEIGLVKIQGEGNDAWELVAWGRGEEQSAPHGATAGARAPGET